MRTCGIASRGLAAAAAAVVLTSVMGAWSARRSPRSGVGTDPGGVREGALKPAPGNSLIAFSSGCFWGAEQAFRKTPGIVSTAVGYSGGSSTFPSYELAHKTGHLETVLVEFNPKRTPLEELLRVFWTLPRSRNSEGQTSPTSSYRATIWTFDSFESQSAQTSRSAMQLKLHTKLAAKILPARPFYLAEEYHQQFDEKSGKELCPALPD